MESHRASRWSLLAIGALTVVGSCADSSSSAGTPQDVDLPGLSAASTVLIEYFAGLGGREDLLVESRCLPPDDAGAVIDAYDAFVSAHGLVRLRLASVPQDAGVGIVDFEISVGDEIVGAGATLRAVGDGPDLCIADLSNGAGVPLD